MKPAFRILLVAFAVCLQLADAAILVLGHSHDHAACETAHSSATQQAHLGHTHACGHHHHCHASQPSQELPDAPQDGSVPQDDCAICRHASQPIALTALVVELIGSDSVEEIALPAIAEPHVQPLSRPRSRAPPRGNA